jgi:hypothetical protein
MIRQRPGFVTPNERATRARRFASIYMAALISAAESGKVRAKSEQARGENRNEARIPR